MKNFVNSHPKWLRALSKTDSVPFGQRSDWLKHVDHPGVRIAKTAWVEKRENVRGNALVYGNAQVYGSAQVSGSALVCGNARVYDSTQVYDEAQVWGNAQVYDSTQVYGNARVCGNAWVYGNTRVYGDARVYGNAQVCGSALIQSDEDYITVGPVGSRNDTLTIFRTEDSVMLSTGCFAGTEQEFMARLLETPEHIEYWKVVPVLLQLLRQRCGIPPPQREEIG